MKLVDRCASSEEVTKAMLGFISELNVASLLESKWQRNKHTLRAVQQKLAEMMYDFTWSQIHV